MYQLLFKPLLFRFPAERAHKLVFALLKGMLWIPGAKAVAKALYQVKDPSLEREVFGLRFPNPVGLAAGFDKDALLFRELSCMGFGFIEIGTLTPQPQPGNPAPRLFRLPADHALINRMGFNNRGVEAAVRRLRRKKGNIIIGGNIGKNKVTPNAQANDDYEKCFHALHPYVDYFVINVSSPNTPNLRELQEKAPLTELLAHVQQLNNKTGQPRPVLLKIAPDLTNPQLDDIVDIVRETRIDGIIATNTTISREGLITPPAEVEETGAGGLSGDPLRERSTEVIRYIVNRSEGRIPVIGVGGIRHPQDALEKLEAGASLVQVYTGFIYEGPALIKKINRFLAHRSK